MSGRFPAAASLRRQMLDPLDLFGLQVEIEDFQVGFHVGRVGGPRQQIPPSIMKSG